LKVIRHAEEFKATMLLEEAAHQPTALAAANKAEFDLPFRVYGSAGLAKGRGA
jgi:hypothetical protein